ncbi:MAG: response regulator [Candidatus Paceibacterota bacterium]|jgi:DNA-binding response OmpR family regulator
MEQKQKIFMIEDDVLMLNLYERTFKLSGFDIEVAKDGMEALGKLKDIAEKPDVIILDIMMPKINGFDVLKQLKKNSGTKNIPVVVLSNLAHPEDVDRVLKMGAAMYLVKSQHDPEDTVKKVKEAIENSKETT